MHFYLAMRKKEILPLATTWIALEVMMLSERSQSKTNTIEYSLYVESKKTKIEKQRVKWWFSGAGGLGKGDV